MTGTTAEIYASIAERAQRLRTIGEFVPTIEDEDILMQIACERRGLCIVAIRAEKLRVLGNSARRNDYILVAMI